MTQRHFMPFLAAVGLLLAGCALAVRFPSADEPVTASGYLHRPDGTGPFAAMVLLHTCSGLHRHEFDWAEWFKANGYVALVVDSFSPRGATNVCSRGSNGPSPSEVALDAFGALAYLRSLPFVDRDRVGVIGWSWGAMAALRAGSESFVRRARSPGFRAAVAFYPECSYIEWDTAIPVLLLLGDADDWTGYQPCVRTAKQLAESGKTIDWKVYAGATHSFDFAEMGWRGEPVNYLGYRLRYSPAATTDARTRVGAFLGRYIGPAR